jgi:hypothetical protein
MDAKLAVDVREVVVFESCVSECASSFTATRLLPCLQVHLLRLIDRDRKVFVCPPIHFRCLPIIR